jgi:hypothetical protein
MQERLDALRAVAETAPTERRRAFEAARRESRADEREVRAAAAGALVATGDPSAALSELARLTADDDVGVRYAAAIALAQAPWRGRLDLLAKLLDDEDRGVAAMAADGLAHAHDRRAAPLLRELLAEKRLRWTALEALYELRDEALLSEAPVLFGGLLFGSPFERALGALVLAEQGDRRALDHLLSKLAKKRAEERPFIAVHLAKAVPVEGRQAIEQLATAEDEYLRESALLALAKVDPAWWPRAQEAIGRWAEEDPHVSAELLLGLFDVDWSRAGLLAEAHVARADELGTAARRVRLGTALRAEFRDEVLLRCD